MRRQGGKSSLSPNSAMTKENSLAPGLNPGSVTRQLHDSRKATLHFSHPIYKVETTPTL